MHQGSACRGVCEPLKPFTVSYEYVHFYEEREKRFHPISKGLLTQADANLNYALGNSEKVLFFGIMNQ